MNQVSIHAPAKGATITLRRVRPLTCVSIHAPAKGATGDRLHNFNRAASFNPRARKGRDYIRECLPMSSMVSIHAPAKGATLGAFDYRVLSTGFQSTRPQRARQRCNEDPQDRDRFQSTRPQRARQTLYNINRPFLMVSIHAPAKGATIHDEDEGRTISVSIHAPAKGATVPHLIF